MNIRNIKEIFEKYKHNLDNNTPKKLIYFVEELEKHIKNIHKLDLKKLLELKKNIELEKKTFKVINSGNFTFYVKYDILYKEMINIIDLIIMTSKDGGRK